MAFEQTRFARTQLAQAYDRTYNGATGGVSGLCSDLFTYNSATDATAAITAADYFLLAKGFLKTKDIIYINGTDGGHLAVVTLANDVTVTTQLLI